MKFLSLVLLNLTFCQLVFAHDSRKIVSISDVIQEIPIPNYENVNDQIDLNAWLSEGRRETETVISLAAKAGKNQAIRDGFNALLGTFKGVTIKTPKPGFQFKGCNLDSSMEVFVLGTAPIVYFCDYGLRKAQLGARRLSQVLIHESAHVFGLADECDATYIEMQAMLISGYGLQFENQYIRECKFD